MGKLNLDALKQRAEAVASEDLLATISGGLQNACHDDVIYDGGTLPEVVITGTRK